MWIPGAIHEAIWIEIKYERLPKFCYIFGRLTHETRYYTQWSAVGGGFGGRNARFGE